MHSLKVSNYCVLKLISDQVLLIIVYKTNKKSKSLSWVIVVVNGHESVPLDHWLFSRQQVQMTCNCVSATRNNLNSFCENSRLLLVSLHPLVHLQMCEDIYCAIKGKLEDNT